MSGTQIDSLLLWSGTSGAGDASVALLLTA